MNHRIVIRAGLASNIRRRLELTKQMKAQMSCIRVHCVIDSGKHHGDIPREFFTIEQTVTSQQIDKPRVRYTWRDERSIEHALCALAFEKYEVNNLKLAKTKDFGC